MSLTSHSQLAETVLLPTEGSLTLDSEVGVEATIASLKQHFEAVRQHEVKQIRGRLGQLNSTQQSAIESLTHGIIDQFLHAPLTILQAASEDNDSLAAIETVYRIFNLGPLQPNRLGRGRFFWFNNAKTAAESSYCTLATKDQNSELRAHNGQAHARTIGQ